MAALDEVAAERQRVADRLARVDAERIRLTEQLAELDAAERVLSRMAPGAPRRDRRWRAAEATETAKSTTSRRGRRARQAENTATSPAKRRGARRSTRRAQQKPAIALGDATLQAVQALGNDASAEQVREYLGREFSIQVRPNHLGMALQRHRRSGRLQDVDGRWSLVPPVSGETATA